MDVVQLVVITVVGVVIVVAIAIYRAWRAARAAAAAAPCALFAPAGIISMFPDECLGTCPGAAPCTRAGTRPYLIFWKQDVGPCTCPLRPAAPPPAAVPPPGSRTAGGSGDIAPVNPRSRTNR